MDKNTSKNTSKKTFSALAKRFNRKHKFHHLTPNMFQPVAKNNKQVVELAGEFTTTTREVGRRFIRNPYNVLSVVILVGIILTAVIVTYTTIYDANSPISSQLTRTLIANLPPRTFGNFVNENVQLTQLLALQKAGFYIPGLSTGPPPTDPNMIITILRQNLDGSYYIRWNVWNFIDMLGGFHHPCFAGTDSAGRDIWTRVWLGTWHSFLLAFSVGITEMVVGGTIGAYIGYHAGGWFDLFMMRIVNVVNTIPPIIWLVVLTFLLPTSLGYISLFISLTLIGFLVPVAYTRVYILKIKDAEYLKAARAIGVSKAGVIFKHAVPNVLGKLTVLFVRRVPIIILLSSIIAFLGLSPVPGVATLGNIINDAKSNVFMWWYILLPTAIIGITVVTMQIISNGLHDAFDPRSKERKA